MKAGFGTLASITFAAGPEGAFVSGNWKVSPALSVVTVPPKLNEPRSVCPLCKVDRNGSELLSTFAVVTAPLASFLVITALLEILPVPTAPLLAWRGLAMSVVTPARGGGPHVKLPHQNDIAARRLHQLYIPGLGEPSAGGALHVEQSYPLDQQASQRGFLYL